MFSGQFQRKRSWPTLDTFMWLQIYDILKLQVKACDML